EPGAPLARLDASMMRRALLNVIVNAAQAAGPTGEVRVRLHASPTVEGGRRYVRVGISDSGAGIPVELAARVFEPFFTMKATGTGLGLAIVKGIVDRHEGEISIGGGPHGGAVVTLLLPVATGD